MSPEKALLSAAIYDRVSKDKRRDARSVDEQEAANITHCDRYGWAVKEVFTDNDRSASRFARKARPDWQRLVEALGDGRFEVLVLWEPSRGDRELEMWARLLNTCRREGVLIHITSHDRTYDVRKPRDWRTLAEDGVDSAYESEKVSERIRRGTRARAAEGRPHGRPLYGYKRVYDTSTGQLIGQVPDPAEAAVVREIADMVLRGISLQQIARVLNDRGLPSPRGALWRASPIKKLIVNPSYLGHRMYYGSKVKSPEWFPSILSEHDHYLCVAKLMSPERGEVRPSAIRHLLSGLAICGVCGGKVKVVNRRYCCRAADAEGHVAGHVARAKGRVDAYVESLVVAILRKPDVLAAMSSTEEVDELRDLLAEVDRERAELDAFYAMAEVGQLSAEGLVRVEAARLPKIRAAEEKARAVRFMPQVGDLVADGPEHVPARWADLELTQQRDIIAAFFPKIEIMRLPEGVCTRTYTDVQSVKVTPRSSRLAR